MESVQEGWAGIIDLVQENCSFPYVELKEIDPVSCYEGLAASRKIQIHKTIPHFHLWQLADTAEHVRLFVWKTGNIVRSEV